MSEDLSLIVLPFRNSGGDAEQQYFSDGVTEDLITALTRVSVIQVVSRSSSFHYKDVSPKDIHKELHVRFVLEGSIRKVGSRIRVSTNLIDAKTGFSQWGDRYDRELQDIFALQDEIVEKISKALSTQITSPRHRVPTANIEAYDLMLRSLEQLALRTREATLTARSLLERAISLDPEYADAHAYLGRTYLRDVVYQWDPTLEIKEKVISCGQQAVALDDTNAAGYDTLAYGYLARKDVDRALQEIQHAFSQQPGNADTLLALGEILNFAGRPQEALPYIERAMALNPQYSASNLWTLGQAHYLLRQYDEALDALQRNERRNPGQLTTHLLLAAIFAEIGKYDDAKHEIDELLRINPLYSLDTILRESPYKDRLHRERMGQSLRRAGLR